MKYLFLVSIFSLFSLTVFAQTAVDAPGEDAAVRSVAEVMSHPPFIDAEGVYKAWMMENSTDFGVVLIEVLGTIPLHQHPDGNRRMFLIEGDMTMQGGELTMQMKPGDFMYLPRFHHHKVWLAPNEERALFILVDNPPVSTGKIDWLEPIPEMAVNPEQAESAIRVKERAEAIPTEQNE